MVWYILGAVVAILIAYTIVIYNKLIGQRNKIRDQWAQIDVQLKRRFDLIPNLLEIVKGYMKHEKETFEKIVKARNSFSTAKTSEEEVNASGELSKALNRIMMLAESYPELKADTSFLKLQENLSEVEEKIAYSRQFYNDRVLSYMNTIEKFPSNILASIFGFKKIAYFEAGEEVKSKLEIKF